MSTPVETYRSMFVDIDENFSTFWAFDNKLHPDDITRLENALEKYDEAKTSGMSDFDLWDFHGQAHVMRSNYTPAEINDFISKFNEYYHHTEKSGDDTVRNHRFMHYLNSN